MTADTKSSAWLEATYNLWETRSRSLTLDVIARDTSLSLSWLANFSRKRTDDYGIKKVNELYDYLMKHKTI